MQRTLSDTVPFELGHEEWATLPELGLPAVLARIDTGARTSALHASDIEIYTGASGPRVRFLVQPVPGRRDISRACDAALVARRWVASSNGARELRCVIATPVRVGARQWPIEVTLTDRQTMRYRMLLGRRAILDDMIVMPRHASRQTIIGYEVYAAVASEQRAKWAAPRVNAHRARGLRIGLLGDGPVGLLWQTLADAANQRGHLVERIDVRSCRLILAEGGDRRGAPQSAVDRIEYDGRVLPRLDAVIALLDQQPQPLAVAILRHLERAGSVALNGASGLSLMQDPMHGWQLLHAAQMPIDAAALTLHGAEPSEAERGGTRSRLTSTLVVAGRIVASVRWLGHGTSTARPQIVGLEAGERRLALQAAGVLGLSLVRIDLWRGGSRRGDLERGPRGDAAIAGFDASPGIAEISSFARPEVGLAAIKAIEARVRAAAVPVEG